MGFFGKVFEKKECDICGGEIGLLGNRKLDDGNLCKECAKKLSPWFEDRRRSTVEDIRKQLAYREANKEKVQSFQVTREFAGDTYHVFLDDMKRQFTVATSLNVENNPDIVDLSQVTSCKLHIEQNRTEDQYRDSDGNMKDYDPPRYRYSYDYSIKLGINSPWFDDMDFRLNNFSVKDEDRMKMMDMENLGNQIVAALIGTSYNQPNNMQGGMYGQPNGMQGNGMYGQPNGMQNNGMYGQPNGMQNNGMYGQANGMQGGMYGQPNNMQGGMYGQPNGMQGNGMYGQPNGMHGSMYGQPNGMQGNMYGQPNSMQGGMYGQPNSMQAGMYGQPNGMQGNIYNQASAMQAGMYGQMAGAQANNTYGRPSSTIRCDKCGWVPDDPTCIPKLCPECGDPIDGNDVV